MRKPHKHAELIKAWADGAEIEYKDPKLGGWLNIETPQWFEEFNYRIKPEPKPDVEECLYCQKDSLGLVFTKKSSFDHNLKLTFDGETRQLKSAEVLK